MSASRSVLAGIAVVSLLLIQRQVEGQRPVSRGLVQGIVVRTGTNEPIAGARVTLSRSDTVEPSSATVTTDPGGIFVFRDVPSDSYRLEATRDGYVKQEYGQRTFNAPGVRVRVNPGQIVKDLAFFLIPSGSVDGRILDSSGNPAVGIPVELLRKTYNEQGQRILELSGSTLTNDRGEYRLFWVTPGRYYVNAGSANGSIGLSTTSGNSSNEVGDKYEPAYYPGVSDVSQAAIVEVRPGDQISAIDFAVKPERKYNVRGRLIDSGSRRSPSSANVFITYLSPTGQGNTLLSNTAESYNGATGMFEMKDVTPGSYLVGAKVPQVRIDARGTPTIAGESVVMTPVIITDSDVENIDLVVMPAATLSGRLRVEGQALSSVPRIAQMHVEFEATLNGTPLPESAQPPQPQFQWLNADGTFVVSGLSPGEYRAVITDLPPDYFVKAIRFNQTDALNEPLHISAGSGSLDVVLSPNGGQVDGIVVNDKRETACGVEVVLIPERQRDRADLYKTASMDETCRFTIRGIPPGDYKVFTWEALEEFAYYDPDLVRSFEQKGAPVRILESSKESLEVKLIPSSR